MNLHFADLISHDTMKVRSHEDLVSPLTFTSSKSYGSWKLYLKAEVVSNVREHVVDTVLEHLDFMPCGVTTLTKHVVEVFKWWCIVMEKRCVVVNVNKKGWVDGNGSNSGAGFGKPRGAGFGKPRGGRETHGGRDGLEGPDGQLFMEVGKVKVLRVFEMIEHDGRACIYRAFVSVNTNDIFTNDEFPIVNVGRKIISKDNDGFELIDDVVAKCEGRFNVSSFMNDAVLKDFKGVLALLGVDLSAFIVAYNWNVIEAYAVVDEILFHP
nr:hypothetical protein [Tanacetum cinerariifolium]